MLSNLGERMYDTDGKPIQAHGGCIQKFCGLYFWYGEDRSFGASKTLGVRLYTSEDLKAWKDCGLVFRAAGSREELENDGYFAGLYGGLDSAGKDRVFQDIDSGAIIERPKIVYNKMNGNYLLWFHADGRLDEDPDEPYGKAKAGVALSKSPYGPFVFMDSYHLHTRPDYINSGKPGVRKGMSRDFTVFLDGEAAYIFYASEHNETLYISALNDSYTALKVKGDEAVYGRDFTAIYIGRSREAPAVCEKDGKYYLITSGCTGWYPNPSRYAVADKIIGEWTDKGSPFVNDTGNNSFASQSSYILKLENGEYVYMGDRWIHPKDGDLGDSRYIFLKIGFKNGGFEIRYE